MSAFPPTRLLICTILKQILQKDHTLGIFQAFPQGMLYQTKSELIIHILQANESEIFIVSLLYTSDTQSY